MDTLEKVWQSVSGYWWLIPIIALVAGYKLWMRLLGIVMIPEDSFGIVNKKFALFGKTRLPDGAIVALEGEAGVQADTLAPGLHFGLWPWQYEIDIEKFIEIEDGKIGIVGSEGGAPLPAGRVLARHVECNLFQDARMFLQNGGERGPQINVLPPGKYRINTKIFYISDADAIEVAEGKVGIVTTKEGKALPSGQIAGGEVSGHNMYQNGQAFIDNGGYKGLQEQVILAGRYFINPDFATIEEVEMTEVPIAHVGVVIAFVGEAGEDVTGEAFKQGNLVVKGKRGVWREPLDPGMYAINTRTHKVEMVPTANTVLNWATGKTEAHNLDAKLSTIKVRSSDGFDFTLDVSQIIHIPRNDAPLVVARFGTVLNLVTQVLEPTIGNYFRNAAQSSDAIDFLVKRRERQNEAKESIREALQEYNVGAVDTLIGDINPPAELMKTLTDRKIAEQQQVTYEAQRLAQVQRQQLEQATAIADTQSRVVDAERQVQIAEFDAKSAIAKAEGDAKSKTINAEADAKVTTLTGEAEATKITAVGNAEAEVIGKKTNAVGQNNFAAIEVIRSLATHNIPLVPQIVAGGGEGNGGLVNILLANLIKNQNPKAPNTPDTVQFPAVSGS